MFDSFLEGTQYYDYPSIEVALFSLLLALVLSSVIAFIYRFTHTGLQYSKSFFQAMVLSPLVTAMIMMAVGNNLAVGFGIMGAVAIIRFRTNIQNPRNIIFIFAALAIGIACGVYGYAVAVGGTVIFSLTAMTLHYSPSGGPMNNVFEIVCQTTDQQLILEVKEYIMSKSKTFDERELRKRTELDNKYTYKVTLENDSDIDEIFKYLEAIPGLSDVRIAKKTYQEEL